MELRLYNKESSLLTVLDEFITLIWHRKYYEVGRFELHAPIHLYPLLASARYLDADDKQELAVIEAHGYNEGAQTCYAKGRFAEGLLDDVFISTTTKLNGSPSDLLCGLVSRWTSLQVIPHVGGSASSMSTRGTNLMEKCYSLAKEAGVSFSVCPAARGAPPTVFAVWQGKDRTRNQSANDWCIFSGNFENVSNETYGSDRTAFRNVAYVAGEGEGEARQIVEVNQVQQGEDRRELWVDARDLQQEESTNEAYLAQLVQRGKEKLAECQAVQEVDFMSLHDATMSYLRGGFDLGDLCTYENHPRGVETEQRVTEILEVHEANTMTAEIIFGEPHKTMIQQMKR